ncbi:MAG: putative ABC transporter permease [Frisingicoccus sp.]
MNLNTDFYHILWFFIIYCVCGWIWESSFCSIKAKKWINRGFLMGPYIPIYGCGALVVYLTLYPLKEDLWLVYMGGVVFPTILEFLTSWIMEKLFAATWWDYSNEKFNIQGRICLKVSLFWGFFSVIMVEILHPIVLALIDKLPRTAGQVLGGLFIVVFSADFVNTVVATLDVKKTLEKMENIREDIFQFLDVHNLGPEYKELSPSHMVSRLKEQWEERREYFENIPLTGTINEYREELEDKLSALVNRYEENKIKHRAVLQHHLKAYPNFKSSRYANSMQDNQKPLEKLRKEK